LKEGLILSDEENSIGGDLEINQVIPVFSGYFFTK